MVKKKIITTKYFMFMVQNVEFMVQNGNFGYKHDEMAMVRNEYGTKLLDTIIIIMIPQIIWFNITCISLIYIQIFNYGFNN